MIYRTIALVIIAVFYLLLLAYDIVRYSFKKNKKPSVEGIVRTTSTTVLLAIEIWSIIAGKANLGYTGRGILLKVFGSYAGIIADVLILLAFIQSLREHIKNRKENGKSNDELITKGIFAFSRNPISYASYFLYIGILMMYFNWFLCVATIIMIAIQHFYVLKKEKTNTVLYGEEYKKYKDVTGRYLRRGKWSLSAVKCLIYTIVMIFSCFYYVTCVLYAGYRLSFVWIWPLLALFCLIRIVMLHDVLISDIRGTKRKINIPKWIKIIYHILFGAAVAAFLFVEINVVVFLNMEPKENLDYVIVLGAGLRGTEPTRPLELRINRAASYLSKNPDAIAICSGGKGSDEEVSEASVIKNGLLELGIDEDRIILEENSTSTIENIHYSYEIIYALYEKDADGLDADGPNVGFVSNGFHIYRTRLIASTQGHGDINGIPAQTLFPVGIHYIVREFFGVVQLVMGWG